ncbi:peptidase S66 family protein [Agrobacterium rubi TR3 = NBRC 13261]|uniref:Peptidase S66 family protein n=1 Tax=Agrobacterium rubi TR3 = NBRC 13261 TaxID=1368415 RepID=A0A081D0M9_9HYPH|nr:peptidase S66 family protein [Agrobacterium rubi TR3 = NBRC 13261]
MEPFFVTGRQQAEPSVVSETSILACGKLRDGDLIRYVSPASTPEKQTTLKRAQALEALGFQVDFGPHAFSKYASMAGTDDERIADLNNAFRDPQVRAVFATRGGKGSYRIADLLDFDAVRRDPKPLLGFSDITALHLMLSKQCGSVGFHGAVFGDETSGIDQDNLDLLYRMLTSNGEVVFKTRPEEPTAFLTTEGEAQGRLIGGNLDIIGTMAGWGLPDLSGYILLIEAVDCTPGRIDRVLTTLQKGGHLRGIVGVAIGQFTTADGTQSKRLVSLLRDHFEKLDVPVLGGLPFGHGDKPLSIPLGTLARLDAAAGTLTVAH